MCVDDPPIDVHVGVELLHQEAVELPLPLRLLGVQQRPVLTRLAAHPVTRSGEAHRHQTPVTDGE